MENRNRESELVITQKVNSMSEKKIINLRRKISQSLGQYSRRNNMHLLGIPNSIPEKDLKNTVINIWKESGIDVEAWDTDGCHRLPHSRNSRGHDKRVIVCRSKIRGNSVVKTSGIYMSPIKLYLSPFAHTIDIYEVNVKICQGKEICTMFFL